MWPFKRKEQEKETLEKKREQKTQLTGFNKILAYSIIFIIITGALTITFLGMYIGGAISYLWFKLIESIIWFFFISNFFWCLIAYGLGYISPRSMIMFITTEKELHQHLVLKAPKRGTNYEFEKVTSMEYPVVVYGNNLLIYGFWKFKTYIVRDPVMIEERKNKIFLTTMGRETEKAYLEHERIMELENENRLLRRKNANMLRELRLEKEVVVERKREEK